MQPNHQVMGTLIGHAVRDHSYEYLTALIRMMMHQEMTPNDTILHMLDTAKSEEKAGRGRLVPLIPLQTVGYSKITRHFVDPHLSKHSNILEKRNMW